MIFLAKLLWAAEKRLDGEGEGCRGSHESRELLMRAQQPGLLVVDAL